MVQYPEVNHLNAGRIKTYEYHFTHVELIVIWSAFKSIITYTYISFLLLLNLQIFSSVIWYLPGQVFIINSSGVEMGIFQDK